MIVPRITRNTVGVDGWPEGLDAAVLGAALAGATGAEVMLVTVVSHSRVTDAWVGWQGVREEAAALLAETRESLVPIARTAVESAASVAHALEQLIAREERDLLVVGSSRYAAEGHVRIGKRARQVIGETGCALAIAPRGLHHRPQVRLDRIGVGYDGVPEAQLALTLAASIAAGAGATLHVRGVVDDRTPGFLGRSSPASRGVLPKWEQLMKAEVASLEGQVTGAAQATSAQVATTEVARGRPADRLLEFSAHVDLLVIGSRRWGLVSRILLGSTGEALLHNARCPILIAPRTTG
jgi:nucleotide-binding universal stress UspA family protein